jgi:hypothetical protein
MSNVDHQESKLLKLLGELILVSSLGSYLSCKGIKQLNNLSIPWGAKFIILSFKDHTFELKSPGK